MSVRSAAFTLVGCVTLANLIPYPVLAQAAAAKRAAPGAPPELSGAFATVNGKPVSWNDYLRTLEIQQTGATDGTSRGTAERLALDQLVTNAIVLADAAQRNLLPTNEAVLACFATQKKLYEQQVPTGSRYEESLAEQGRSVQEVRDNLRVQMAQTNLYAHEMGLTEADVHKAYDQANGKWGLPARALLRLIVVAPDSAEFARAQQMLEQKRDFADVARAVDAPQLAASGGLLPQFTPIDQISAVYQKQIIDAKPGDIIGPIDFQSASHAPASRAWIRVEDKRPPYSVTFEEAAPLIRQQIVQRDILDPQYAPIRNRMIAEKMNAVFVPVDPRYQVVWNAIKREAREAGVGTSSAEPRGPGGGSAGGVQHPLVATLTAEPKTAAPGSACVFTFTVKNVSIAARTINFASGKRFDVVVSAPDSAGQKPVWRASDGHMYTDMLGRLLINPGETKTFTCSWPVPLALLPGEYTVHGFLTATGSDDGHPAETADAVLTLKVGASR